MGLIVNIKFRIIYDLNSNKNKQIIGSFIARNRKSISEDIYRLQYLNIEAVKFYIGDNRSNLDRYWLKKG